MIKRKVVAKRNTGEVSRARIGIFRQISWIRLSDDFAPERKDAGITLGGLCIWNVTVSDIHLR